MKIFKKIAARYIIPPIGFLLIYLIGLTCREEVVNKEAANAVYAKGEIPVITFWHQHIVYMTHYFRWQNMAALVSPSPDGEIIAHILELFGVRIIWGSTFKNPVKALLNMRKEIKGHKRVAIIADGSRGPAFKAQDGAIKIALLTGAPVIPITYGCERRTLFKSWDRLMLPHPFTKTIVIYGDPIYIPKGAGKELIEEKRQEVEASLNKIKSEADSIARQIKKSVV